LSSLLLPTPTGVPITPDDAYGNAIQRRLPVGFTPLYFKVDVL
jgi:hypothetical protein